MEPRIGIAAGMIKTHTHLPFELIGKGLISHVTVGSYTLNPRPGNPEPTTWVSADQTEIMNAIGLKNAGLQDFLDNELMTMRDVCTGRTKLRVSLAPTGAGELCDMVAQLNEHCVAEHIDELEINAACPNHRKGTGTEPVLACDMEAVEQLLEEAADYPGGKALKIAPDTERTKLECLVELCVAYNINTIVSGNTRKRSAIIDGRQVLSVEAGGHSGLPLLADTMRQVQELRSIIQTSGEQLRIIACGGVLSGDSAATLLEQRGADEVQVATLFWLFGEDAVAKLVTETGLSLN